MCVWRCGGEGGRGVQINKGAASWHPGTGAGKSLAASATTSPSQIPFPPHMHRAAPTRRARAPPTPRPPHPPHHSPPHPAPHLKLRQLPEALRHLRHRLAVHVRHVQPQPPQPGAEAAHQRLLRAAGRQGQQETEGRVCAAGLQRCMGDCKEVGVWGRGGRGSWGVGELVSGCSAGADERRACGCGGPQVMSGGRLWPSARWKARHHAHGTHHPLHPTPPTPNPPPPHTPLIPLAHTPLTPAPATLVGRPP